jgi:polysaccharide export outer membrane protein
MSIRTLLIAVSLVMLSLSPAWSQSAPEGADTASSSTTKTQTAPSTGTTVATGGAAAVATAPRTPRGYVIGTDDILQIVFWREKELSGDVVVRPDGRISLPLLNDVVAAGRTPEELREALVAEASQYFGNPNPTVVVKEIRSRKVFITGAVEKPGPYIVTSPTTVLQLISMAGGLKEYADKRNIVVMRTTDGKQHAYVVDYHAILRRQNLEMNFLLMPGDTVLVR